MKKFILLLALLIPLNAFSLTLDELSDESRRWVKDSQTTRKRFTDTQITSWLNEAQRIADMYTMCVYDEYTFDLAAGYHLLFPTVKLYVSQTGTS